MSDCRWCGHPEAVHMHGPDFPGRCRQDDCRCQGFLAACNSGNPPRRVDFVKSWVRRRWVCFRSGHKWALDFPFGPNYCERCGRLVEW